jgi:hypothetical protein
MRTIVFVERHTQKRGIIIIKNLIVIQLRLIDSDKNISF